MNADKLDRALSDGERELKRKAKKKKRPVLSVPDIYTVIHTRSGKKTVLPCEFHGVGGMTRIDGADYVFVVVKPRSHRDFPVVLLRSLVRLSWFGTPEKQAAGTGFDPEIFAGDPPLDVVNTHAIDADSSTGNDTKYPVIFKADVILDILERHGIFKQAEEKRLL